MSGSKWQRFWTRCKGESSSSKGRSQRSWEPLPALLDPEALASQVDLQAVARLVPSRGWESLRAFLDKLLLDQVNRALEARLQGESCDHYIVYAASLRDIIAMFRKAEAIWDEIIQRGEESE